MVLNFLVIPSTLRETQHQQDVHLMLKEEDADIKPILCIVFILGAQHQHLSIPVRKNKFTGNAENVTDP